MSQNPPHGWEPPSSGEQPGQPSDGAPPPPAWGQPAPQYGYGQQPPSYAGAPAPGAGYGPPPGPGQGPGQGQGFGAAPGYGAPPTTYGLPVWAKPGVVPLRPLSLGEILDGAVQTIRQNPRVMLGMSAVVNLVLAVIVGLVQWGALSSTLAGADSSESSDSFGAEGGQLLTSLFSAVLQAVGTTVLTGLLVIAVSDAVLGRRPGVGEVWTRARGRIWALLGTTLIIFLTLVALGVIALVPGIVLLATGHGLFGGLLLFLGIVVFVGGGAWIWIRWLFAPPVVLLERTGVGASLGRSWRLVSGSWWRCFGILLLAQILATFLSGVLQTPFLILGFVVGVGGSGGVFLLITSIGGVIARTLIAPFSAAILALLYIDLRMRREGLDVTLQQAASAGPAGPPPT